jgi:Tfp pilus assembly protein PilF
MMWRIYPVLFFLSCCLLNGQQDSLALLNAGQRAMTNGSYLEARRQIDAAVESARNVALDPAVTRRIVLAGAEVRALMADFKGAGDLARALQDFEGVLPEQQVRLQIVLAQCAIGMDDLRAASNAAAAAVDLANRANLNGDWKANALAELAEVRRLEGNFAEARQLSFAVVAAREGRLSSLEPSSTALIAPPEVAFSIGQLADARSLAEKALDAGRPDRLATLLLRELLARVAIEEGRLPDAARLLDGLTGAARSSLGPTHPFVAECLLTEAAYAGRRSAWGESRAKLEEASRLNGSRPSSRRSRLRLLLYNSSAALGLNRIDDAGNYLAQAAPLAGSPSPELASVLNAQAAVAIERQRYEDAEKDLRNADSMLASLTEEREPVRMKTRFNLGLLYARWGDAERAEEPLARWIELRPTGAADEPEAVALSILGHNAFRRKQFDRAATLLSRSLDIRSSVGGKSGTELSAEYEVLGNSLAQSARPEDAVAAFRRALDLKGGQTESTVADLGLNRSLAETLQSLGRTAEALPYFDTSLRLMSQAGTEGSEEALRLADQVSQLHTKEGQWDAAEPLLLRLYDAGQVGRGPAARDKSGILERLGETEARLNHNQRAASCFDELARIDLLKKDLPKAEAFAARARDVVQNSPDSPGFATALSVLADVVLAQGKPEDARNLYLQAASDPGASGRTKAVSFNGQGKIALTNHDGVAANQFLERALDALKEDPSPSPGLEALIVANSAAAQASTDHIGDAERLYSRFLDLEPQSNPPQDPPLLDQLNELARFYSLRPGRAQDVLNVYNRVVNSSKRIFGEQSDDYAWALYNVALSYAKEKQNDEAIARYSEASSLFEQSHTIQSDEVRTVRIQMVNAYLADGKTREAIELIDPVLPSPPDMSDGTQTELLGLLAELYRKVGDPGKAIGIYQRLIDAFSKPSEATKNLKWLKPTENLIAANIEKGDDTTASTLFKTAQKNIHRSENNKDSQSEVELLRAYSGALKTSGRGKNDKKLADQIDDQANQMAKRL